uniref:Protein krueppel n=1 Tax=Anopheles funestus TaxID=62324 RepID=A0A4Y0BHW2_ANOFN
MRQNALCRVCASTDAALDLVDIFDGYENEECVADILLELAGIKATINDGFPRNCCTQCHADLTSAVAVRRKCIESDKLIQATLDGSCPLMDDQSENVSMVSSKQEQIPTYHCSECSIDFYNSETLQEHYHSKHANVIHGWKSFGISEISLFDTTDEEEDEKVASDSETTHVNSPIRFHRCCGCLLTFHTDMELKQHSDTVHASNVQIDESHALQCNVCRKLFTNAIALENHQNVEYLHRFQCARCGILFGFQSQLARHEFKHMRRPITCHICNKIFSHPEYMNTHMKRIHLNYKVPKSIQKHVCNQCGKTVSSAAYLRTHLRLHSNDEPFSCTLCGARFKLHTYLKWHMALHTGVHKCKECDASYKSPSELQDHMNTHIGTREFSCAVCGSNFYTRKSLFETHETGTFSL